MGWTCTTVVYDEDPAGMIKEQRVDPRRMRWDPSSRKKNLADTRWVQCDYWYDDDEIEERWPDVELEISPTARYNAGTATQLDVLSAQVDLTTARTNQLQAFYTYNVAVASLRKAMGQSDEFVTTP
jgi:hypothetical protein